MIRGTRRNQLVTALVAGLAVAAGCERLDPRPRQVAEGFWGALEVGDLAAARQLSTAPGEGELRELAERHAFASVEIGQVLRNETAALAETRAVLAGPRATEISFNTHLGRYDGDWLVEVADTRREVVRAALEATVEDVKESLAESAEVLSDAIERSALEFSEALREALEGVEQDLRREPPP